MTDQTRERAMTTPCPHCGGELRAIEVGHTPAEFQQPTHWSRVGQHCASTGCTLLAGDVDGQAP